MGRAPVDLRRGDAATFGLAALVLGVAFAGLTVLVLLVPSLATVDQAVGAAVIDAGRAAPILPAVALVLDVVGGGPFATAVVAVVVLVLLLRPPARPAVAAFLVLSGLGGAIVNTAVKALIDRQRPPWVGLYASESSTSYPSGHAMAGITVYVALAGIALLLLRAPWRWPVAGFLLVLGPLIGVSRVVLGVHWASDVLGGWLLGAAWLSLSAYVVIRVAANGGDRRLSTIVGGRPPA